MFQYGPIISIKTYIDKFFQKKKKTTWSYLNGFEEGGGEYNFKNKRQIEKWVGKFMGLNMATNKF